MNVNAIPQVWLNETFCISDVIFPSVPILELCSHLSGYKVNIIYNRLYLLENFFHVKIC